MEDKCMTKGKKAIVLTLCAAMAMSCAACDDSGKASAETSDMFGALFGGESGETAEDKDEGGLGVVGGAMLDYVVSSRVTSADTTAAQIRHAVDNWLTDIDTRGYGMKMNKDNVLVVYMGFSESNGGGEHGNKSCSTSDIAAAYTESMWKINTDVCEDGVFLENDFEDYMGDLLPEASGTAAVVIRGGACKFAAFTPDSDGGTPADMSASEINERISAYMLGSDNYYFSDWSSGTSGIGSDGKIYGTYPKS